MRFLLLFAFPALLYSIFFIWPFEKEENTERSECGSPPPGMVCIPAGPSVIGRRHPSQSRPVDTVQDLSSRDRMDAYRKWKNPGAKKIRIHWQTYDADAIIGHPYPAYRVYISTFYLDRNEVTNIEYSRCVEAGACDPIPYFNHPLYEGFREPDKPAVPISWKKAFQYCVWAGKRLPTEAEWEKAARGGEEAEYPWGQNPPSCERANYQGCRQTTVPSGSHAPGAYGLHDMAGNGYEWVNDWATDCREGCPTGCGDDCLGKDPQGPCSGKYPCGNRTRKVLKGGSWFWPVEHVAAPFRRLEKLESGGNRLSFRCAADSTFPNQAPAWMIRKPPAAPPDLETPDPDMIRRIHQLKTDTLDKPLCDTKGWSSNECKDPTSYIVTNEHRHFLLAPYIKNLGGGYLGVAAEANYSMIAHARSRVAWLFDFDMNIVRLHKLIGGLVKQSRTAEEFVQRFHPSYSRESLGILAKEYAKDPDRAGIESVYSRFRHRLYQHYSRLQLPDERYGEFGWLRNPNAYKHIRTMYLQGRIVIVPGDMLKDLTMNSIASAARETGVPIRVYYPSDAESHYRFNENYKSNVRALPFDEASVVIRTIWQDYYSAFKVKQPGWHAPKRKHYWHYVVHGGQSYQKKLQYEHFASVQDFLPYRVRIHYSLSTVDLPSGIPESLTRSLH